MEPTWAWSQDEEGRPTLLLKQGDKESTYRFVMPEDKMASEFGLAFMKAREVMLILQSARLSFQTGEANYDGATKKLQSLIGEYEIAGYQCAIVGERAFDFFTPPSLRADFQGSPKKVIEFAESVAGFMQKNGASQSQDTEQPKESNG